MDGRGPITFVDGADTSYGAEIRARVDAWNKRRGYQKVDFVELQADTDVLRSQMVAQAQDLADAAARGLPASTCYDVMMTDVIRTVEFARAGYIAPLDRRDFDTSGVLRRPLASGVVDGTLWAIPMRTDAAFLYYRKDILAARGLSYPRTWASLVEQARTVAPQHGMGGYVSQFARYEGLTVNLMEAMWAAAPEADRGRDLRSMLVSPAAKAGIDLLAEGFRDGWIPGAAAGYTEERSREAFQSGGALFMRNWPYAYRLLAADPTLAGRFDVAPLPGPSVLGGWNLAIGACSTNRRTAREFITFLTGEDNQRILFETAGFAPVLASLYDDPALLARYPYLAVLKSSLETALIRPSTAYYYQVTEAIQERLHPVLIGQTSLDGSLPALVEDVDRAMLGR